MKLPLERMYIAPHAKSFTVKDPDDLDAATLFAESGMNLHPWGLWHVDGTPEAGTEEIVAALNALRSRYDYVVTTGGIGPTQVAKRLPAREVPGGGKAPQDLSLRAHLHQAVVVAVGDQDGSREHARVRPGRQRAGVRCGPAAANARRLGGLLLRAVREHALPGGVADPRPVLAIVVGDSHGDTDGEQEQHRQRDRAAAPDRVPAGGTALRQR